MAKNEHPHHLPNNEDSDIATPITSKNDSNITAVWLDEEAIDPPTSPNSRVTIDMLKKICDNNYKLYNCVDLFLTELESMSTTMKLIVIMSGSFAETVLPKLSASLLREISSIFIFCKDYERHKDLFKKCRKIIAVCTDDHSLKEAIENELHPSTDFVIMNRDSIPIFSLKEEYQGFLWYKLYIEVLKHSSWSKHNIQKMLTVCMEYYEKDNVQKNKIEQFKNTYTPDQAIEWYTRDSFLYRLVNKALRSLDMEEINKFREYIKDLCKELEQLHTKNQSDKLLTVFRGHGNMTTCQLETIIKNDGALISFNGFLSTSTNYNVAVMFAGTKSKHKESVIFEIKTNYNLKNVVFADISQISNMQAENEVLFSLCSVFKIDSVVEDKENQLWKILMSASDENTPNISDYLNKEIKKGNQEAEHRVSVLMNHPVADQMEHKINNEIMKNNQEAEHRVSVLMDHPVADQMEHKINDEVGTSESNRKKNNCLLNWTNRCIGRRRIIIIASVMIFFIIATVLAVVFGLYSKSKLQTSSSDSCENINCTTFSSPIVRNGVTVVGGNRPGNATNQLNSPFGFFVDDDQTIVIADWGNDRIMQWGINDTNGKVVAGGRGTGDRLDQLKGPTDVLIDKETDSLIICDRWNRRVVRWSRRSGTTQGEIFLDNIFCSGLAMDDQRNVYVSDTEKDEVRRYQMGHTNGTVVAGGYGNGDDLNQLSNPYYIFVDRQQTIFVSDTGNHRVMKWNKDANEGLLFVKGQGTGDIMMQLSAPQGLFVDTLGTLFVVDDRNDRVMRWFNGTTQGTVIIGGNGQGEGANQLNSPDDLFCDQRGNCYVVDSGNARVQRFSIE